MIKAENLSVHYTKGLLRRDKIKALDGLTLNVREGDFFALLGRNGAGKSTAMYCFLGLVRPTAGSVKVFGERPFLGSKTYERIAYLPEEPHYHTYLTIEEALNYYCSLYRKKTTRKKIDDLLERLGIAKHRGLRVDKCSKGMKQKMGIAQCVLSDPQLLFLDEPTRGLDPETVKEFREILRGMHRAGTTIVINTHILSEVESVATRIAVIDAGKVVAVDDLGNLLENDPGSYMVGFIGEGDVPEYVSITERRGKTVRGQIPSARMHEFLDYVRGPGLRLLECSLKKSTLEDSFMDILKRARDVA